MKNSSKIFVSILIIIILVLLAVFYYKTEDSVAMLPKEEETKIASSSKEEKLTVTEENNEEVFLKNPAIVKSITKTGDGDWTLELDILSYSANWIPGGDVPRYVNQSTKIRNLTMNENTLNYVCDDVLGIVNSDTEEIASKFKHYLELTSEEEKNEWSGIIYNFDIRGSLITATFEECSS